MAEEYEDFIFLHEIQLKSSGVPEIFWPTLYHKLTNAVFDAGDFFCLAQAEEFNNEKPEDWFTSWKVLVSAPGGIQGKDPKHVYLIDHAWTFRPNQSENHLKTIPGLLERMCLLTGQIYSAENFNDSVRKVMQVLWKYSLSYSIGNSNLEAEDRVPIWYVLDEFGSRIQHSECPTVRIVPFYHMNEQVAYSIFFPLKDLEINDEITRDFVEGCSNDEISRAALLSPWNDYFFRNYLPMLSWEQPEPPPEYFMANRFNESLPNIDVAIPELPRSRPIKTYVEYSFIREFLKHPRFHLVDDSDEAEILWLASHFKEFRELSEKSPHKLVNQFPFEHLLTVKDLLCIVSRRAREGQMALKSEEANRLPYWLPTTFNLKTELPQFLSYSQYRKEKGDENLWIIKPWNLARSLDTHITGNCDFILRLATTGPKIAQTYIDRPVLFYRQDLDTRVKFDVRYIILLRSVKPLTAFVYKRFWLRFANKPFELDHFDDYERHFTVMNYSATPLHQMYCHDFIRSFEEQNPDQKWSKIEERIFGMLRELLSASVKEGTPSIVQNPQSRAMYAVDLMLAWTDRVQEDDGSSPSIEPKLLEVNWAPDCKRACSYYPEFFDDIFSVLFLDEIEGRHVHKLV